MAKNKNVICNCLLFFKGFLTGLLIWILGFGLFLVQKNAFWAKVIMFPLNYIVKPLWKFLGISKINFSNFRLSLFCLSAALLWGIIGGLLGLLFYKIKYQNHKS